MKNSTQTLTFLKKAALAILACFMMSSLANAQTVMYGDTIFWENFGNGPSSGDTRSDISGRGAIGGLYKYEGPLRYVYALNPLELEAPITGYMAVNSGKDYITDAATFHEVPISTSSTQYSIKPAPATPAWTSQYYRITNWKSRTFGTVQAGSTETLAEWDDATSAENNIPAAWIKIGGVWKFGFYYITYEDLAREVGPQDGHYALISDLLEFGTTWLNDGLSMKDHTGMADISTSPMAFNAARTSGTDLGKMLFVNCSAVSGVTGAVYKRQVTELCRDAEFEFSAWVASVHYTTAGSQFRVEFWSADPGNDPGLGALTSASNGQVIAEANNATLIHAGATTSITNLSEWMQIKEQFKLVGQDYVWVVVRNYGAGGTGNDIVIDDLVFRPWAPFNLTVALSLQSINTACVDGLVTLLSTFPASGIPAYVDIPGYGFYFQGLSIASGNWERVGSATPIQTQSASIPLELTLPLAEYNLYSHFRVTVATTPTGFGGRCITFTYPPVPKESIAAAPAFTLTGDDICDDQVVFNQSGKFTITNTNVGSCAGWQVKVRLADGTIKTLTPQAAADGTPGSAPCK